MIKIKNISSAMVTVALPDIRLRRTIRPGFAMPFKEEEYEYLTFDPGFNALVDGHYLKVTGLPENLGIEEIKSTEANDIKEMLRKRDITAFAKMIKDANSAEKDSIVKYAVELGIIDSPFAALIKQYCGIDIIGAVNNYHQSME